MATAPQNKRDRLQTPLMFAFRDAHKKKEARVRNITRGEDGARVVTQVGTSLSNGATESLLKLNLSIDLVDLVNTVNLGSSVDLDGLDQVKKSILNYGLDDMAHLTSDDIRSNELVNQIRRALLNHEPRLIKETLTVERSEKFDDVNQKFSFEIFAEMACKPMDIPLEFVAEIDVASGKLSLAANKSTK